MRQRKRAKKDVDEVDVDAVESQRMLVPSAPPFEIHNDNDVEMLLQPTVKNRVAVYEELSVCTSTPIKPLARKRVKVNSVEEGDSILASSPDLTWSPTTSASWPPAVPADPPPTPRGPALPPRPAWLTSPVSKDFYQKINLKSIILLKSFL
jgi:hypothetical protein